MNIMVDIYYSESSGLAYDMVGCVQPETCSMET